MVWDTQVYHAGDGLALSAACWGVWAYNGWSRRRFDVDGVGPPNWAFTYAEEVGP